IIDFAQILSSVGEFGAFQKRLLVAVCLPNIFEAFHMFGQVFTAISFPHNRNSSWIVERAPNLTEDKQLNLTIPQDSNGQYESSYGINTTTPCTYGWVYKAPEGISTLITEVINFFTLQFSFLYSLWFIYLFYFKTISSLYFPQLAHKHKVFLSQLYPYRVQLKMPYQMKAENTANKGTMLDLFRVYYLRKRALIMCYMWFVTSLVYYGVSLNVGNFGLDIYLTQLIFGIAEFPRFGRRICQSAMLLLGGTACLITPAIPAGEKLQSLVLEVQKKKKKFASKICENNQK
uniref:Solute carrier family 22 member 13b n=1 Tax=Sinocyclocheilus anshuiensis TaxID=1608454 RepID=A0A671NGC3_9TELE